MKSRWLFGLAILCFAPAFARAATFTVTKTADTADGSCDADCSLREAVIAANANAGADTITTEAQKLFATLEGKRERPSSLSTELVDRLRNFLRNKV